IADANAFRFHEGKLRVDVAAGTERVIACERIIFAAGQASGIDADFGLALNRFGYPETVGAAASEEGVFAAGDIVTGTKTVIDAIAAGRDAASASDRCLGGDGDIEECLVDKDEADANIGKINGFAALARKRPMLLDAERRAESFDLADRGLAGADAARECERCLQCDLRERIAEVRPWNTYAEG
ncbi:MAG: ferredoxin, partial [Clostridiales Family XIII bacterium]|nr:ferredoxin [Clostridiales Family XIII bacterium]